MDEVHAVGDASEGRHGTPGQGPPQRAVAPDEGDDDGGGAEREEAEAASVEGDVGHVDLGEAPRQHAGAGEAQRGPAGHAIECSPAVPRPCSRAASVAPTRSSAARVSVP